MTNPKLDLTGLLADKYEAMERATTIMGKYLIHDSRNLIMILVASEYGLVKLMHIVRVSAN